MHTKVFIPIRNDSIFHLMDDIRDEAGLPIWQVFLHSLRGFSIFVDTDCPLIKERLEQDDALDLEVYLRDPDLCAQDVTTNDLILHFLDRYRIHHEVVIQLHINHPFLRPETLHAAAEELSIDSHFDSVLSCHRLHSRFWLDGPVAPIPVDHNPITLQRSSDLRAIFNENSAFYVIQANRFRALGSRVGVRPRFFEISESEAFAITHRNNWTAALGLARNLCLWKSRNS